MTDTTALVLCGKHPVHIVGVSKALLPQGYDIIHVCNSLPAALTEIPALLRGDTPSPSSGYGSNATTNAASPTSGTAVKAIIIGGGYSADDAEQIKAAVDGVKKVPIFRADTKPRGDGAPPGPPAVEEVAKRVFEALEKAKRDGELVHGDYVF